MTRKERDKVALRLAMEYLSGESDEFTRAQIHEAVRFALVGGDAPAWWAEYVYELRGANREYREEMQRVRCEACEGKGWLDAARVA